MTLEEMQTMLKGFINLVSPENQATASETLTTLTEGITTVFSERDTANTKITELTENNETLRAVNAKLFLKVGEVPKEDSKPSEQPPKMEEVTFDSLFNEKGELN